MGEEFEPLESDVLTADLDVAREKIRTLEQERDAALARVAEEAQRDPEAAVVEAALVWYDQSPMDGDDGAGLRLACAALLEFRKQHGAK